MKLKKIILVLILIVSASCFADTTEKNIEQLSNAYGVSGYEQPVREILQKHWQEQGIKFEIDNLGNLIGKGNNFNKKNPTVLIMAHMDEVGFLTSKVTDDGFIKINPLGGWIDHVLWSQKWAIKVGDKYIPAISGMDAPHVLSDFTKTPVASKDMLFLDTGLSKKELDKIGMRPGLAVVPDFKFQVLKAGEIYLGKAFDDRAGLAAMIDIMKKINTNSNINKKINVVFAATVQEELGMRGSKVVYESLKPDLVLNLEAAIAKDYPTQFTKNNEPKLGHGPTLFVFDGSMMPNQNLVEKIYKVAQKNHIPMQWELENSYGQDGSCLQLSGKGMPVINLGIPVRYAHSHAGVMNRHDYDNLINLVLKSLEELNKSSINSLI